METEIPKVGEQADNVMATHIRCLSVVPVELEALLKEIDEKEKNAKDETK